eukprot:tig00021518_g22038.t1
MLPCKHSAEVACATPVEKVACKVMVPDKLLPCSHKAPAECGARAATIDCPFICDRKLPCGHPCTCGRPCKQHDSVKCRPCDKLRRETRKELMRNAKRQHDLVTAGNAFSLLPITEASHASDWNKAKDFVERLTQTAHKVKFKVVAINKIVNPMLEMQFFKRRANLVDPVKELELKFHGTKPENIDVIARNGFKLPPPSKHNMYGQVNAS